MPIQELTELQYSDARSGAFKLYIYDLSGYHGGATWFSAKPRYPEEITATEAMYRALEACGQGLEVRLLTPGDCLVYHAIGHQVFHPKPVGTFWADICRG